MSSKKMFRGEELVVVGELEDPCNGPDPTVSGEGVGTVYKKNGFLADISMFGHYIQNSKILILDPILHFT